MVINKIVCKGIIVGIVALLVGAGLVPSIDGNMERIDIVEDVDRYENEKLQSEEILEKFASASMFFTKNKGQFPEHVLFQTHAPGATVYLYQDKIVSVFTKETKERSDMKEEMDPSRIKYRLHLDSEPLQMEKTPVVATFVDANKEVTVKDNVMLPHYNNYFMGNDPDKWYTNVPNYQEVIYKNIYPGIDLRYYYHNSSLKYDFIVHPGADPSVITICYEGVENLRVTPTDDLEIMTCFGEILENAPLIYQEINGVRHQIAGGYEIREPNVFGFTIELGFNPLFPLVIDPELVYSTFLGGINYDNGCDIAVDNEGNAYVTGFTNSDDIPMVSPYDGTRNGGYDVFVAKLSPSTGGVSSLVYSTYIGGDNTDTGESIAVDNEGNAYVTGFTYSEDFPTTPDAYDNTYNGVEGLEYQDVYLSKFSASGDSLLYSTYLGGTHNDMGWNIIVDSDKNAYITGGTQSDDFPTTPDAYDDSYNGGDIFGGDIRRPCDC